MGGGGALGLAGYRGHVETARAGWLAGKAVIRGEIWDFRVDEALSPGDRVEVVGTDGLKLGRSRARKHAS